MKVDLATAIISAVVGIAIAYLITSTMILKSPASITIQTLNTTTGTNLDEPNTEVFNYRALNPTVEAYVDCSNYDASGSCIDKVEE